MSRPQIIAHGGASRPQVIAHRGASLDAPENTLTAFEEALAQGADRIELDVQLTADGVAVVHHDPTLTRSTDAGERWPDRAPWDLRDVAASELAELTTRWPVADGDTVCRVPTLREVLAQLAGRTSLLLELKAPERNPGLGAEVVAELERCPSWLDPAHPERLTVQSFDHDAIVRVRDLLPAHVPYGWVFDATSAIAPVQAPTWVTELVVDHDLIGADLLATAHTDGRLVHAWTVNDPAEIARLADLGVDGIITDAPGLARRIVDGDVGDAADVTGGTDGGVASDAAAVGVPEAGRG